MKFLIYTHYHGDHNLGAGAFLEAWPHAVIASTQATRANMTGKPMDYIKTYSEDYAGAIAFWKKRLEGGELTPAGRVGAQQMVDAGDSIVAGYRNMRAYPAALTFTDKLTIPDNETPVDVMFLGNANTDGDGAPGAAAFSKFERT